MTFRRYRFRLIVLLAVGIAIVILLTSKTSSNVQKARLRRRRLKWYVYDEYEDSPASEYLDIPPKIITQPPIERPDEEYPNKLMFTKSLLLEFPWATTNHDYTAESKQFISLIKNTEKSQICSQMFTSSKWSCCLTDTLLHDGIVYTFDVEQENNLDFEYELHEHAKLQAIHAYNPNIVEPSNLEETDKVTYHKIALDTESNARQNRRWTRQTFQEIRTTFDHTQVSLVRLNMNSSEWKIMKQLLENGEIMHIKQLVVKIHLHWAGFGISGSSDEVVHQWYNIISSILQSGMTLVASRSDEEPKIFMSEPGLFDTSCCYYLTFAR